MKYFPPGLKKGLLISFLALLIFIFVFTPLSRPLRSRIAAMKKEEVPEEMETLYKEADEESYSKFIKGKSKERKNSDEEDDKPNEENEKSDGEADKSDEDNIDG